MKNGSNVIIYSFKILYVETGTNPLLFYFVHFEVVFPEIQVL